MHVYACLIFSYLSHLTCAWNEMKPSHTILPSTLVWIARLISHSLEGWRAMVTTQWHCVYWWEARVLGDTLLYPPLLSVSESGPVWGVKRVWVEFEHLYIVEGHSAPEQNVTEVQGAWEEMEERAVPTATQLFRDAAGFKESKQIIH